MRALVQERQGEGGKKERWRDINTIKIIRAWKSEKWGLKSVELGTSGEPPLSRIQRFETCNLLLIYYSVWKLSLQILNTNLALALASVSKVHRQSTPLTDYNL